jgi:hypothetical protein
MVVRTNSASSLHSHAFPCLHITLESPFLTLVRTQHTINISSFALVPHGHLEPASETVGRARDKDVTNTSILLPATPTGSNTIPKTGTNPNPHTTAWFDTCVHRAPAMSINAVNIPRLTTQRSPLGIANIAENVDGPICWRKWGITVCTASARQPLKKCCSFQQTATNVRKQHRQHIYNYHFRQTCFMLASMPTSVQECNNTILMQQ